MICCYHTEAKGQLCKEIIPIFLCVALLLSFTLPEIGDYTIRELIYGVQDTITVVSGTRIACEIIAVSNPGYVVYTIYAWTLRKWVSKHTSVRSTLKVSMLHFLFGVPQPWKYIYTIKAS